MENITDIIKGCTAFDQKCQRLIYDRFKGFALKIVFRYVYTYEKATDVTNDGFVKLFSSFDKFRAENKLDQEKMLMGWIRTIMIHCAIDELRRKEMVPEIGGFGNDTWDVPDHSADADQLLLYKDIIIILKKLPPKYRVVFNMYVIDGYSHFEIASVLGISPGTSKSTLSRARTLLQKYILDEEAEILCNL